MASHSLLRPTAARCREPSEGSGISSGSAFNVNGVSITPGEDFGGANSSLYWFNPRAFLLPVAGTFGNAGRNQFLGPNLTELDTSLFKTIRINERWNLQFRAEAFNILNRANFGQPTIGVYAGTPSPGALALCELPSQSSCPNVSPSAGVITSTATTSRQLQLALKLMF